MKMPKDKLGNKLSWKEYMQRWKRGISNVTPLQQVNIQIKGTYIIIIGLCAGIFITALNFKQLWWLTLILVGGMFNTVMQLVGLWQKKMIFNRIYNNQKEEPKEDKHFFVEDDVMAQNQINEKEVDKK